MLTSLQMPKLGESVIEGTVSRWLKREGEHVDEYEPLLEIITDKVDTEIPSPAAGVVLRIYVEEGETVAVGTLLADIGDPRAMRSRSGNRRGPREWGVCRRRWPVCWPSTTWTRPRSAAVDATAASRARTSRPTWRERGRARQTAPSDSRSRPVNCCR